MVLVEIRPFGKALLLLLLGPQAALTAIAMPPPPRCPPLLGGVPGDSPSSPALELLEYSDAEIAVVSLAGTWVLLLLLLSDPWGLFGVLILFAGMSG